jgi:hypothetical protein
MLKMKKITETFDMKVFTDSGEYFGDVEEAIVTNTEGEGGGFRYAFKDKQTEKDFIRFKDCLHTWRPPMSKTLLTPQNLLRIYDELS